MQPSQLSKTLKRFWAPFFVCVFRCGSGLCRNILLASALPTTYWDDSGRNHTPGILTTPQGIHASDVCLGGPGRPVQPSDLTPTQPKMSSGFSTVNSTGTVSLQCWTGGGLSQSVRRKSAIPLYQDFAITTNGFHSVL